MFNINRVPDRRPSSSSTSESNQPAQPSTRPPSPKFSNTPPKLDGKLKLTVGTNSNLPKNSDYVKTYELSTREERTPQHNAAEAPLISLAGNKPSPPINSKQKEREENSSTSVPGENPFTPNVIGNNPYLSALLGNPFFTSGQLDDLLSFPETAPFKSGTSDQGKPENANSHVAQSDSQNNASGPSELTQSGAATASTAPGENPNAGDELESLDDLESEPDMAILAALLAQLQQMDEGDPESGEQDSVSSDASDESNISESSFGEVEENTSPSARQSRSNEGASVTPPTLTDDEKSRNSTINQIWDKLQGKKEIYEKNSNIFESLEKFDVATLKSILSQVEQPSQANVQRPATNHQQQAQGPATHHQHPPAQGYAPPYKFPPYTHPYTQPQPYIQHIHYPAAQQESFFDNLINFFNPYAGLFSALQAQHANQMEQLKYQYPAHSWQQPYGQNFTHQPNVNYQPTGNFHAGRAS